MKAVVALLTFVACATANPLPLVQIIVNVDAPSAGPEAVDIPMPIDRPTPEAWPVDKPVQEEIVPEEIVLPMPIIPVPLPEPVILPAPVIPTPVLQPVILPAPVIPVMLPEPVVLPEPVIPTPVVVVPSLPLN